MRRASALLACALACARTSAPPPGPVPAAVEPAVGYATRDTTVVLHGDGFTPSVAQQFTGGGRIVVDTSFRASLGTSDLRDVRWLDSQTLGAVVPAGLAPGTYGLTVEGPFGRGTADNVFRVFAGPPAALTATAIPPTMARVGVEFAISQTISNDGGMAALGVAAGTAVLTGPGAALLPPTEALDLPAGAVHVFTWRIRPNQPGALGIELPIVGVDEIDRTSLVARTTTSVTVTTAPVLVTTAQPAPASAPVGMLVPLAVDVRNQGGCDALAVQLTDPAGSAIVRVVSSPLAQDVPAGATRTFEWTVEGTSTGTATLGSSGAGTDPVTGAAVPSPPVQWQPITFQSGGALTATLTIPPGVLRNELFNVALAVTNPGANVARAVQPVASLSGTANGASIAVKPAAADIAPGQTVTFNWTVRAGNQPGTLQIDAGASGTDAVSGQFVSVAMSAITQVSDVAFVAGDPFADGATFAYVFTYAGRVYFGPSADGRRAMRVKLDGTGAEIVQLGFQTDSGNVTNLVAPTPTMFPSLGYLACTPNTLACGPDNEDGRGILTSFSSSTGEWLFAGGGRQTVALRHAYATADTTIAPLFPPIRLGLSGGTTATAATLLGTTLHVGVANGRGAGAPGMVPVAQPFDLTSAGAVMSLPASMTNPAGTGLVEAMAVYKGVLYAANGGGCARYDGPVPGWVDCTPSNAAWALTPVTTSKTSDFVPADKGVSQMAVFAGGFYLARNTTLGPQIWTCGAVSCGPLDWILFAPNTTGNLLLSQFNDAPLKTISLLTASTQHLFVGYDAPSSAAFVVLYRSKNSPPQDAADFAVFPATPGLGAGMTQILDGKAVSLSREQVYLTARTSTGPVQVFRLGR